MIAAFLRGVALSDAKLADPEKTLERIGAAVRASVTGLRQTLMARASIKDEFRIEQTMIRPSGNNPLKFSLDDDDALATLLGIGRRSGMPADEAMAEAFATSGCTSWRRSRRCRRRCGCCSPSSTPEIIEQKAGGGGLQIHPAQKKAKAWDAFGQLHKSVTQALVGRFRQRVRQGLRARLRAGDRKADRDGRVMIGRRFLLGAVPAALAG